MYLANLSRWWMFLPLVALWFIGLGDRPYSTPDEARYVEIPREMVMTGDWITPRLNGVLYFEKPPLFYWIQATVQKLGADTSNEGLMRLPNLLIAFAGLLATYLFARRYSDEKTAFRSVWILATCVLYYAHSRLIILDMTVSVCVMCAFYSFYNAICGAVSNQRYWMYATSISVACGVLTKGIVVLVLLGPVWLFWLTNSRLWARVKYIPSSLVLFLLCVAPWHIACGLKNPDFCHKYFWVEHVMRYTTTVHGRYQPVWYFLPIVWVGFLPWSAIFPRIGWSSFEKYLVLWAAWVFFFYSFSNSKLIPYVLPMMAPMALLWAKEPVVRGYQSFLWGFASLALVLSPVFFPELYLNKQGLLPFLYAASFCFVVMALLIHWYPTWNTVALTSLPLLWILNQGALELQKPSIRPLVPFLLNLQKESGGQIVSWRTYLQDLPLYAKQTVNVVEAMNELEYGAYAENTSAWIFSQDELVARQDQLYYLVGRLADRHQLPQGYQIVASTPYYFVALR